jgi:serine/threonine protein kinase
MNSRNSALLKLGYKALRSRAFRNSDDFFDEFTATLTQMGGVYAKFLQGVLLGYAVNRGKKVHSGQFDVYEDNPDPQLSPHVLLNVLGEASSRVQITDYTPIGVGSYSAVYSGVLDGGKPVIIKVLRPDIHDEIRFDLKFLRKLTYLMQFAGVKIVAVDITQFYSSFKKACLKETDFVSEIEFATEMYERYKDHPTIVVPKTYNELSSTKVIVQDRIDGLSAKMLVEAKVKDGEDIFDLTKNYYSTDLIETMRALSYEMFHSFLSGKSFHGDLHPGNVRILPNNRVALLDFGIKAEPYKDSVVPAAVNKLVSDGKFLDGDFDLVRILDAHFRLYMSSLYASIESLLQLQKVEMTEFFNGLVASMGITIDNASTEKRMEWLHVGPASMINDMLAGGSEQYGIEVRIKDQSTQRAITTQHALLKALGMRGATGLKPVYDVLCPRIMEERPELFSSKKTVLPDIALENIYGWLEKLDSTNPDLARKVRRMIDSTAKNKQVPTPAS